MKEDFEIQNNSFAKRHNNWLKKLIISALVLVILAGAGIGIFFGFQKFQSNRITIKSIKKAWSEYDYQKVYEQSFSYLQNAPYNNTVLTYYAYACFFLSQAQSETQMAQEYLDESINSLRIAIYSASKNLLPQLQYMLGRAYFYKNTISTHYYADLSIKYLLLAKENNYDAPDIPEYLGLSYAALGMTMESISAFTEALLVRESDALLLSIAEQYFNASEYTAAEQYLYRIIKNCENDDILIQSHILLGNIYINREEYDLAMEEFNNVLKKNVNSADAHYGIGVIYEKQGNIVKARAEWRQALKLQVNHADALKKMANN
ncbi:MAG: tetratricopeptide repeat protein [Treponema sp.]|nr:tetratricopeptide repeat protein [Treponema sp.]